MKRIAGIDIGSYSIKLIELEDKKGHLEVTKCATSCIVDGDIKSALKDLLSLLKLSLKHVNVSLAGPSVVVRYIEMPPMKKEELRSAIKFEAEKFIPFNINDSIVDCSVLETTSSGAQRVLLVAVKKSEVNNLLGLFKDAGLEIGAIDIDSFALLNSFQRLGIEAKEENVYALINMGARFSNMNIITRGSAYFTRDISWGGQDITNRIRDVMGITLEEAEALKQNPAEKKEEIINVIAPLLGRFTSEIRMSFDYFESQFGKTVERFYISGGTSYLFNIVDFLKNDLDVDVLIWNPLEGIGLSESISNKEIKDSPRLFTVAVGLALRGGHT